MELTDGPVDRRVSVDDVGGRLHGRLGLHPPSPGEPTVRDWLAVPQQKLAEVTGGANAVGPGRISRGRRNTREDGAQQRPTDED
ncbi:hypothetical protein G3I55_08420 [Streptomyces sp. SID6648]|nr:hypothetical protein [Streptomyces sp. SID6648]